MSLDKKLSELQEEQNVTNDDELYLVKGGVSRRAKIGSLPITAEAIAAKDAAEAAADDAEQTAASLLDSLGTNDIYNTLAEANADIANITEGEFVTVLADETNGDLKAIYRKEGGVLVLKNLLDSLDTIKYPHLSQNKSQSYWLEHLLAKVDTSIVPTPSLDLDFENGVYKVEGESKTFAEAVTYTRASDATKYHASGKLATVGVDEPQFEYDPETGERYLLLEPERENLLTYSEQFDNAAWIKVAVSITPNAELSPDGNITADIASPTGTSLIRQVLGSTPSLPMVLTVYARRISGSGVFNLDYGDTNITEFTATDEWQRFQLPIDNTTGKVGDFFDISVSSDIALWGAQLEEGSYPTSYIKTEASTVTRAAPSATVPVGEWFNPNEGTFVVDYVLKADSALNQVGGWVMSMNNGTENERVIVYNRLGDAAHIYGETASGGVADPLGTVVPSGQAGDEVSVAFSFKENDFKSAGNGLSGVSSNTFTVPDVTQLNIGGAFNGFNLNAVAIKRIAYYPKALNEAQLKALTSA